jgi:hypothetical protein
MGADLPIRILEQLRSNHGDESQNYALGSFGGGWMYSPCHHCLILSRTPGLGRSNDLDAVIPLAAPDGVARRADRLAAHVPRHPLTMLRVHQMGREAVVRIIAGADVRNAEVQFHSRLISGCQLQNGCGRRLVRISDMDAVPETWERERQRALCDCLQRSRDAGVTIYGSGMTKTSF